MLLAFEIFRSAKNHCKCRQNLNWPPLVESSICPLHSILSPEKGKNIAKGLQNINWHHRYPSFQDDPVIFNPQNVPNLIIFENAHF